MTRRNHITLPNFLLSALIGRVRCPKCGVQIGQQHVVSAGVSCDKGSAVCFTYEFQCPVCRKPGIVKDETRLVTRPDWWNQIAEWHDAAPPVPSIDQLARDSQIARQTMPKIGPMILNMAGLESVWIRGAYMGEVGPVFFIFEGTEPNSMAGVLQLERDQHVSLFNFADPFCIARLELGNFAALPDYGTFQIDGHAWIKMPISDIKDIITDNVFNVLTEAEDDGLTVTTSRTKKRSDHGSTHASTSRKRNRRPPPNARSVDS